MKLSFRIRLPSSGLLLLMGMGPALGHVPVVDAGPDLMYKPRETMLLQGTATDSDGTISLYSWTQESGPTATQEKFFNAALPGATAQDIWLRTSPLVAGASLLHLKLDRPLTNFGGTVAQLVEGSELFTCLQVTESTCTSTHRVGGITGFVPAAAVSNESRPHAWGFSLTRINGGAAYTQLAGQFTFDADTGTVSNAEVTSPRPFGPVFSAVAPSRSGTVTMTFRLTATDNEGGMGSDDVVVTVTNTAPTANAGDDISVDAGTTVFLPGSATDAEGSVNNFLWNQTSGPTVVLIARNTATARFTAPSGPVSSILLFKLTTIDLDGAAAVDEVIVNVAAALPEAPEESGGGGGSLDLLMLALLGLLAGRATVLRRQS